MPYLLMIGGAAAVAFLYKAGDEVGKGVKWVMIGGAAYLAFQHFKR